MSTTTVDDRFKVRRGTAAALSSLNEIPLQGEWILETDTLLMKMGDGATHYNSLPYFGASTGSVVEYGPAVVAGAAATTLTLSGLNLDTDKFYDLEFSFKNATGSASDLGFEANSDTTATNYYRQSFSVSGGGNGESRANNATAVGLPASTCAIGFGKLMVDQDGKARLLLWNNQDSMNVLVLQGFAQGHNATGNVTSITIRSAVANALAIGSYILAKKVSG